VRGSVQGRCDYTTALDIEVDPCTHTGKHTLQLGDASCRVEEDFNNVS
jgi:hypothetical protein